MMLVRALTGGFNLITVEPNANPFSNLNQKIDFTAVTPYQLFHSVESLKNLQVKHIIVGGNSVSSRLEEIAQEISSLLYETYGMTETSSHIALRQFNGLGKSEYFTILKGVNIGQDKRNCLVINAPHLLEKEISTNDIVELIGTKTFRWLGRADNVINSGGVKIHPEQVEKKIEGSIQNQFFISSLPDQLLDQKVVIVIESEQIPEKEIASLQLIFEQKLHKFEVPKKIICLKNFSYSPSNKILRKDTLEIAKNSII